MSLKKLPIFVQLIMMLLIIMVIPTATTVYYSTVSLAKYAEEEIADSVGAQLRSNGTLNERELFNIVQSVLTITENSDLKDMKGISSYKVLNSNYSNIGKGLKLLSHMQTLQDSNEMIESVVFIPEDWDYIVSSKKSIAKKVDYNSLEWLEKASEEMNGVSGYWYPRMEGSTPVITYIYKLNRLTTSLKGVIAVNIYESKIHSLLNSGNSGVDAETFMMMEDGTVLSHEDKSLLFQNKTLPVYITKILNSERTYGNLYIDQDGRRTLCAYYKPSNRNWIYGVTYSMEDLLAGVQVIRNKQMMLMAGIMIIGVIITIIYATKFSKPMRQLADELKKKNGWNRANGNEIMFLSEAFENIEKEEEKLYLTLKEREKDTRNQILHNLLSGEIEVDANREEIGVLFPHKLFMAAIIAVDHKKAYLEKLDPRSRSYQRYLLTDFIHKSFPETYKVECTRYEGGNIAIIMNMEVFDQVKSPKEITVLFKKVQESAKDIFKETVSIGISGVHIGCENIKECIGEALEAVSKKIFIGNNCISLWKFEGEGNKQQYFYPYESAEKIMNYLYTCDLNGVKEELDCIEREMIMRSGSISYENIRMVFNQLAGITVKFMMQQQINLGKSSGVKGDIYSTLSSSETIGELKEALLLCYSALINDMLENKEKEIGDQCYSRRILDYLNEHYREDLLYEEVAEQIGISYSYLRKIVKEQTGKSVSDYINKIRIEKMKSLLITTEESVSQIAEDVGYHNIQSAVRYFKKFEGITPKEFKAMNQVS